MFENLSEKLLKPLRTFGRTGKVTEADLKNTMKQIRMALLEADVHFKVTKEFLKMVEERAVGQELIQSISPGQQFIKIVHDALVEFLGGEEVKDPINLSFTPPVPVMLVGLQGSGKTTTCAKIAGYLKNKMKKRVLVVPADNRRPAAKQQLQVMAKKVDVECFDSDLSLGPAGIAEAAMDYAQKEVIEVVLIDTAGRLAIDEDLMQEVEDITSAINPKQTIFVADSMTGQDAVNVAQAFHDRTQLSGVVLTKLDGDARGGAALSIKYLTGLPITFVGVGEGPTQIEAFHPSRLANRILDMGDVVSLVEKAQEVIDEDEAMESIARVKKGSFTLEDFLKQMRMMKKIGSMESIIKMLPGGGQALEQVKNMDPETELKQAEAIICSMTSKERRNHKILNGSRRARIAHGSGTKVSDVNRLIKKYDDTNKMMSKMMKTGMMKKLFQ